MKIIALFLKSTAKNGNRAKLAQHFGILLVLLAFLSSFIPSSSPALAFAASERGVGSDISAFSTTDINGVSVSGEAFSEHDLTLLHYFATWSEDSVRELAFVRAAMRSFPFSELGAFGLLYEDSVSTPESCAELFEELGCTHRCLRLDDVLLSLVSEYPMLPQTFLVDSNGIVVEHFPGALESAEQLIEMIEARLDVMKHTVTFVDGLNGSVISSVKVLHLSSATPPTPPLHVGYVFAGWQGSYENVTEDRTVTGIYTEGTLEFAPGDVNTDGTVSADDAVLALRGALGLIYSDGVSLYGDVSGDGLITVVDAVIILRAAMGLIEL